MITIDYCFDCNQIRLTDMMSGDVIELREDQAEKLRVLLERSLTNGHYDIRREDYEQ